MKLLVSLWPSAQTRKNGRSAIESVELGMADMMVGAHICLLHQHRFNGPSQEPASNANGASTRLA